MAARISRKRALELGIPLPPGAAKKPTARAKAGPAYPAFEALCEAHGLPRPVRESEFHDRRKWRFDFLFDNWLALEVDGGSWTHGRHNRAQGFQNDMEKLNEAAMLGFVVLRVTPADMASLAAIGLLRRAYFEAPMFFRQRLPL